MRWIEKIVIIILLAITACTGDDIVSNLDKSVLHPPVYIKFRWKHPDSGSQVVDYDVESQWLGIHPEPSDCPVWLDDDFGYGMVLVPTGVRTVRIRVRGVDADGVRGPWSLWSNWKIAPYSYLERRITIPVGSD